MTESISKALMFPLMLHLTVLTISTKTFTEDRKDIYHNFMWKNK